MAGYVAVIGPGTDVGAVVTGTAREVGRMLAERGAIVLTGGLGGVMAAAAEGARSAGGTVVGLLPGGDRDRAGDGAGDGLSISIPTGLGELRNGLVVRSADAVICVGGSWGTLSEVALARRAGLPVVCLHGWRVADADGVEVALGRAETPAEAVDLAMSPLR
jgi:uncharacterized protein (TIGR00725 family)